MGACWPLPLRGPTMAMMVMEATEAMDTVVTAMEDTVMVDTAMVDMDTGILTTVDTAAMGTATVTGMDMGTGMAMEDMGYTRGALITSRRMLAAMPPLTTDTMPLPTPRDMVTAPMPLPLTLLPP